VVLVHTLRVPARGNDAPSGSGHASPNDRDAPRKKSCARHRCTRGPTLFGNRSEGEFRDESARANTRLARLRTDDYAAVVRTFLLTECGLGRDSRCQNASRTRLALASTLSLSCPWMRASTLAPYRHARGDSHTRSRGR
jgi:hypothetical protein